MVLKTPEPNPFPIIKPTNIAVPVQTPDTSRPDSTITTIRTTTDGVTTIDHTYANTSPFVAQNSIADKVKGIVENKYVWLAIAAIILVGFFLRK